ncbi:hypothetical protein [Streptomyces sp. NPDC092307]|uniref:hypothetical protein n=1 Tax=Streptomyces sp. NPDC092307 TaxID=3366013 RepID=UPI0038199E89
MQRGLLAGWADGRRAAIRQRNNEARTGAVAQRVARAKVAMTGGLPATSQVLGVGVTPDLVGIVFECLPEGLRNDGTRAALAYGLHPDRIAENGRSTIGMGEYVLPVLKGRSTYWSYDCEVGVSLTLSDAERQVTRTEAAMDSVGKTTTELAARNGRTTGPTFSAGVNAGQLGTAQPGGTGNLGVAYKRETMKELAASQSHDHTNSLRFPAGTAVISCRAEMAISIRYTKKARSPLVQGEPGKWLVLDRQGVRGSDGSASAVPGYEDIFSGITVVYAVPFELANLPALSESVGTDTDVDAQEVWV